METKEFEYDGKTVGFEINDRNVMVNATQMAKLFGKQVNEFMSNTTTQAFVNEALKNGNSRFLGITKEEDLVRSRQKSGTWMHRVLALKFAASIPPSAASSCATRAASSSSASAHAGAVWCTSMPTTSRTCAASPSRRWRERNNKTLHRKNARALCGLWQCL